MIKIKAASGQQLQGDSGMAPYDPHMLIGSKTEVSYLSQALPTGGYDPLKGTGHQAPHRCLVCRAQQI